MKKQLYFDKKTGDIKTKTGTISVPWSFRLGAFLAALTMLLVYGIVLLGLVAVFTWLFNIVF